MRRRLVYNDSYTIGEHNRILYAPPDLIPFFIRSIRYCIGPAAYGHRLPSPDAEQQALLDRRIRKRYGSALDTVALRRLIDDFNEARPEESLERARGGTATQTDKCHFAAARHLRNEQRMHRLSPEYKAYRVNQLIEWLDRNIEPDLLARDHPIPTLHAVCWHVKQTYLPDRSFYEKR